jgi:hypothetical protein
VCEVVCLSRTACHRLTSIVHLLHLSTNRAYFKRFLRKILKTHKKSGI